MTEPRRQRLRFVSIDYDVEPDGSCRVEVSLEWLGDIHRGEARGMEPLGGDLRTAAEATLLAAARAADEPLELTLIGIKRVRAFDTTLVVSALRATEEREGETRRYKLVGAKTLGAETAVEATARSVLDALNRVLERYVAR